MALADLIAAGSDSWVAVRLFDGVGLGDIWTDIQRQFPLEGVRTLEAALNRGFAAFQAGRAFQTAEGTDRLLASEVPRPTAGGQPWRYAVLAEFGPVGQPSNDARWIFVTNPESLTRGALGEIATQLAQEMAAGLRQPAARYASLQAKEVKSINIAMASRL